MSTAGNCPRCGGYPACPRDNRDGTVTSCTPLPDCQQVGDERYLLPREALEVAMVDAAIARRKLKEWGF